MISYNVFFIRRGYLQAILLFFPLRHVAVASYFTMYCFVWNPYVENIVRTLGLGPLVLTFFGAARMCPLPYKHQKTAQAHSGKYAKNGGFWLAPC